MKIFCWLFTIVCFLSLAKKVDAVEVGDIYYSDKTFSENIVKEKNPIGLVYWVSPAKDYGRIIALKQSKDKSWQKSIDYCEAYSTKGSKSGSWVLPELIDLKIGVNNGREGYDNPLFMTLNKKLKRINGADLLDDGYYWSSSEYGRKSDSAWGVDWSENRVLNLIKIHKYHVRCVMNF